jgi:hypothetical protein
MDVGWIIANKIQKEGRRIQLDLNGADPIGSQWD